MENMLNRGCMTYQRHETSMDYLELCINKFRSRTIRKKPKSFSDILISTDKLCGQVKYPQVNRIINAVREAKSAISLVWSTDDGLSNRKKRNIAEDIRQDCTMRYLVGLIDSKEYSDISRFLFGILFGQPNEEFYKLIELSKGNVYKLQECSTGDIQIYDFHYKQVLV